MKLTMRHPVKPLYLLACLMVLAGSVVSCKKDRLTNPFDLEAGTLSMKIDGNLREAESAFVLNVPDEESGRHIVTVTAFFTPEGASGDDEVMDAFHIYLSLSDAEFKNPKGTYDIIYVRDENEYSGFYALYQVNLGSGDQHEVYGFVDPEKSVGKLTITDFEIGNGSPSIPGLPSVTGYAKLKGTFQMQLTGATVDQGKTITITEGKFSVRNQFGFL